MDVVWWTLTAIAMVYLMWNSLQRLRAASQRIDEDVAAFNRDHPWRGATFVTALDALLDEHEAVITRAFTTRFIPVSRDSSPTP